MIVCVSNACTVFFKYILINSTYKFSIFLFIFNPNSTISVGRVVYFPLTISLFRSSFGSNFIILFLAKYKLRVIYNSSKHRGIAYKKLALWFNEVTDSGFKSFNTISATIYSHYNEILNYFNNRATNASAESFNAKIKRFRTTLHGVRDLKFFFFRLAKIYA